MIVEKKLGESEDYVYSIDPAHNNQQEFDQKDHRLKLKHKGIMKE